MCQEHAITSSFNERTIHFSLFFWLFIRFTFYCLVDRALIFRCSFRTTSFDSFFIFSFFFLFFFVLFFYVFVHMHVTSLAIGNKKVHVGKLITGIPFYFSTDHRFPSTSSFLPLAPPPFDDIRETNRENDHEREIKRDDRGNGPRTRELTCNSPLFPLLSPFFFISFFLFFYSSLGP